MSDGMTDKRSQNEPLLSGAELVHAKANIRTGISDHLFGNESFQEMRISEVRRIIDFATEACINELRKIQK